MRQNGIVGRPHRAEMSHYEASIRQKAALRAAAKHLEAF